MRGLFINNAFFRLLWPIIHGCILYLLILLINNSINMLDESFFTQELYFTIGLTYLVFEANRLVIVLVDKQESEDKTLTSRIFIQVVINIIVTGLLVSLAVAAYFKYLLGFSYYQTELTYLNIIFMVTSLMYNMVFFSNIYLFRQNEEMLEEESILKQHMEKEFHSFKNDINPELLYESLESLITLVHRDPMEAEDYIDRLSFAYRYILSNKQNEFVPLQEDLKAAENLVLLLNTKYDGNLVFQAEFESSDRERQVIPGTLPGIIENIVRKNIVNKTKPLILKAFIEQDHYLSLQYKANERLLADKYDNGVIENLQKAYSFYSDQPVVKVEAYGECYIKIPALELKQEELVI